LAKRGGQCICEKRLDSGVQSKPLKLEPGGLIMTTSAVLNFYRATFPDPEDPTPLGPWGPVIVDGLLEGSRAGRDLVNFVLQLETAASLTNGLPALEMERTIEFVRITAMNDCGNVPKEIPRPKGPIRIPKGWPSPIALSHERVTNEFNHSYQQGYALGYATELHSLAFVTTNSALNKGVVVVANQVMTKFAGPV
jgi:hypothetical protein